MQVMLLPSSVPQGNYQYLASMLVNDAVAFDAGSLGLYGSPEAQSRVCHVFLSHSHLDHLATLPIFLENVSTPTEECPTILAPRSVLEIVRRDILNDCIYPDFIRLSDEGPPLVQLQEIEAGVPVRVRGLQVTAIPVHHIVPTYAYVIESPEACIAYITDTGPTDAIWKVLNRKRKLRAVFLELTFPNSEQWLADISRHLTPATFARELAKLRRDTAIYAIHLKARYLPRLLEELADLDLPNVQALIPGLPLEF